MDAAYAPRELVVELRQHARQQYGHDATTDVDLDGTTELKVEYRAAIVLDRQADRIELLEATLRSIATGQGERVGVRGLCEGALNYPADRVPTAIATEDGDVAWVEVTPITETAEQVQAALVANGMVCVEDNGTVYGWEVSRRTWMVPCIGSTERPLLSREAVSNVQYEDEIVYFELDDQEGCETGAWWWRCDEKITEPSDGD